LSFVTAREDQPQYTVGIDPDPDSDPDTDGNQEQTDPKKMSPVPGKQLGTGDRSDDDD
jgi:hypothetical protein